MSEDELKDQAIVLDHTQTDVSDEETEEEKKLNPVGNYTGIRKLFMQDWFFLPLMAMLGAGVFTTNYLYFTYKAGSLQGVAFIAMMESKDWIGLAGMGIGLVIARILEGSMVGLLDIGGGMMITVGAFAMAIIGQSSFEWILYSLPASLICGAVLGAAEAVLILLVRKFIPAGVSAGGTDIMMDVGYKMGEFMGPLFIISALSNSIPMGICASIGGAIAYARGKNIIGGIIIGILVACFIWA